MNKISLPAWTEKLRKGSHWILGNMQANVSLSAILALNGMDNAFAMLRNRPDIFRFQLKQMTNRAIKQGDMVKTFLMLCTNYPKEMDQYTDCIVDVTSQDVTELRHRIQNLLDGEGVPEAELTAWVETARLLLHLAVEHFNSIMQQGEEKVGLDYTRYFRQAQMDHVLETWYHVAALMDPRPELITEELVLQQIRYISAQYANGNYLVQCCKMMKDNPLFADIEIKNDGESSLNIKH